MGGATRISIATRVATLGPALLLVGGVALSQGTGSGGRAATPPVHHVFLLVLENESFDRTFGLRSPSPYLARTLVAEGALVRNYYGIGHASLDNYIAMISGQAPNEATQGDCDTFVEFHLSSPGLDKNGQAIGSGCAYPATVPSLPEQLDRAKLTWKAYMEDLGNHPRRESATCGHPPFNGPDHTEEAALGDQYATKHNPFFYFHAIIDHESACASHVVPLTQLTADLASIATTPNYVFITPNLCNDGHDAPCVDHSPGGLVQVDRFLRHWVPLIRNSPAFKQDGVLIITFDEGLANEACCGEQPLAGQRHLPGYDGPGGGRVGAVVLSPFVRPGTVTDAPYNHYSMLRWVEDVFGLSHLGYAAAPSVVPFGKDIFGGP